MNRRVRVQDLVGAQTGDFEEIAPDDWRGVDVERNAGICIYRWENVITRLADLIGGGYLRQQHVTAIEVNYPPARAILDAVGNTWIDHEYLAPHEYLPRLIPKEAG